MIHTFTPADRTTAMFKQLRDSVDAKIEKLRAKNDGDLSDLETAKLRGQLAALKELRADMEEKKHKAPAACRNPYQ